MLMAQDIVDFSLASDFRAPETTTQVQRKGHAQQQP